MRVEYKKAIRQPRCQAESCQKRAHFTTGKTWYCERCVNAHILQNELAPADVMDESTFDQLITLIAKNYGKKKSDSDSR